MLSETFKHTAETIILYGAAFMALLYGLKRVYTLARNVEKLVENSAKNEIGVANLYNELRTHIATEEAGDNVRDKQLIQLTDHIIEIVAEMRPNGGTSMKDLIQNTSKAVNEVNTRVGTLEQWRKVNKKKNLKPRANKRRKAKK
jgi:hypothetical protein